MQCEVNVWDFNYNIGVGVGSDTNVHNIGVGTCSSSNNPLDCSDFDECFRNNKKDKGNETDFSLHNISTNYLF